MRKPQSNGSIGEQLAEIWFKQNGWKMFRHQSPTRVIRKEGKLFTVPMKSDGIADYTGYCKSLTANGYRAFYLACEVKEAKGNSMPASRLEEHQRDWMNDVPKECAFVGICWMDGKLSFEVFRFVYSGGYKRGQGLWKTDC